ncbi:MAG: DNA (cytosine-5-)-methyltransferase [Betaproteobacteria bacterium]|nr:MAG: DNA (cytosine-5-)-methyltransferase [Betaproteobacteria bacterium]
MALKIASFFSGIGGLELGLERAGCAVTFQCEAKPFCLNILQQHWPKIPRSTDIRRVKNEDVPDSDVWTAGFPCQDLSLARMGTRSGLRGSQSGLFHDFVRLLRGSLPRAVVLENVHGLLSSHGGRDFTIVLKALDELGYGLAWRVLNSKDFGVPQQRRRVFIVGVHRDAKSAGEILFEPECSDWNASTSRSNEKKSPSLFQKVVGNARKGPLVKALAHCVYAESARHTGTDWSRNYVWYPDGRVRRFTPNEVERVQGFPDNWTLPTHADEIAADRLDSLRYHAVGNAVTPQVAAWLGQRLIQVLEEPLHTVGGVKEAVEANRVAA